VELILLATLIIGLDLMAVRWGKDSRNALRSREHQQADLGLRWPR
jgi:hypothetical protein